MLPKQLEEYLEALKKDIKKQIALGAIVIIIFIIGTISYGFLSETGKNLVNNKPVTSTGDNIAGNKYEVDGDYVQGDKYQTKPGNKKQNSNKIYQDNIVVGEITGEVKIDGGNIFFEELSETSILKRNLPFEYQGVK